MARQMNSSMGNMSNIGHDQTLFRGGRRSAIILGVVGLAVCAAMCGGAREAVMQGYLLAYLYWAAVALGSLSLLLLQFVSGGRWGITIRRLLEAGASTIPVLAVLFIPIALQLQVLYPWARPEAATDQLLQLKAAYLNPTAFVIRTAICFVIWTVISRRVIHLSRMQDTDGSPAAASRLSKLSAPSLVIYALSVTFAAVDWGMSLEPQWFSTIYGVIYAIGAALAALSFAVVVLSRLANRAPFDTFMRPETSGDFGNLSLAFTMFWTYVSLSQFLIIWAGHLPEERPWYWVRLHGGWEWVGIALAILQFAVPFLLLLSQARKRTLRRLACVSLWILCMRFVDLTWLVAPAFSPDTVHLSWLTLPAMAGIGGVWVFFYLRHLASAPLLPVKVAEADAHARGHGHD